MALPTISKSWIYKTNQSIVADTGSIDRQIRKLLVGIKNALVESGKWTVVASANGSTTSTSDLWTNENSFSLQIKNFPGQSWMILRNTNIGPKFDLAIEYTGFNGGAGSVFSIAPNGFSTTGMSTNSITNGGASTLVAGDIINFSGGPHYMWDTTGRNCVFHTMVSADGQCTRVFVYVSDVLVGYWIIDKAQASVGTSSWPIPFIFAYGYAGAVSNVATVSSIYSNAILNTRFTTTGNSYTGMFPSAESYSSNLLTNGLQIPNDLTGDYPLCPIGVVSTTAPYRGRHGDLSDLWFGVSNMPIGTTYPGDGSGQFAQHGCFVTPWNGSVIKTR